MQDRPTKTSPNLFTPIEIGPLELPNRIVMAPLTRSRAGEGNVPTSLSALYYAQRASAGSSSPKLARSCRRVRAISPHLESTAPSKSRGGNALRERCMPAAEGWCCNSGMSGAYRINPSSLEARCRSLHRRSSPRDKRSRQRASNRFRNRARSSSPRSPPLSPNMRTRRGTRCTQDSMVSRCTEPTAI